MTGSGFESGTVTANGVAFAYLAAGEGPLLLCLHGFPDHAHSFRPQLETFSRLGYRVVAPFMRGYAPTVAAAAGPYQSAALAYDVIGLIDALGGGRATVLGHDWGAIAAYGAAVLAPERLERLVTLSIPYGPGLAQALVRDRDQQLRSWYMFFFLSPFAEPALASEDFAFLDRIWADWSPGWQPEPHAMAALKDTFRRPGVVKASLAYYRHAFLRGFRQPELDAAQARMNVDPVRVPTLYLHGSEDGCIAADVAGDMTPLFPNGLQKEVVSGCGHFLHLERPDEINGRIAAFLGHAS